MKKLLLLFVLVGTSLSLVAQRFEALDFKDKLAPSSFNDFPLEQVRASKYGEAGVAGTTGDFNNDGIVDFIFTGAGTDGGSAFMVLYLGQKNANPIRVNLHDKFPAGEFSKAGELKIGGNGSLDSFKQADGTWVFAIMGGRNGVWYEPYSTAVFSMSISETNEPTITWLDSNLGETTGGGGGTIFVLDANKDGFADVLQIGYNKVGNKYTDMSRLYINDGTGTFELKEGHGVKPAQTVRAVKGDLNNDGLLDIAYGDSRFASKMFVYLNNGNGTFTERVLFDFKGSQTNGEENGVETTLLDVNNDGNLDVVFSTNSKTTNPWSFPVWVFLNDGKGNFTQSDKTSLTDIPLHGGQRGIFASGDYNNDGAMDLILTTETQDPAGTWANKSYLYLGNGEGQFKQYDITADFYQVCGKPTHGGALLTGDFNQSGTVDLMSFGSKYNTEYKATLYYNTATAISNDASLYNLSLAEGELTPAFNPEVLKYSIALEKETNSIEIFYNKKQVSALVEGAGIYANIEAGTHIRNVVVTAPDGITKKTYEITVNKEASANANISSLTLSTGVLSPYFDKHIKEYKVNLANDITSIEISATPEDSKATITGGGMKDLSVGENTFPLVVTPEDVTKPITYTIKVYRADKGADSNSTLSALSLDGCNFNSLFEPTKYRYISKVGSDVMETTILATASNPKTTISGLGTKTLNPGKNTFEIVVVGEDGSKSVYEINVEKEIPAVDGDLSGLFEDANYDFNGLKIEYLEPQGVVADFNGDGIDDLFVNGVQTKDGVRSYFAHLYVGNKEGNPIQVVLDNNFFGGANPVMDYVALGNGEFLLAIQGTTKNPPLAGGEWYKNNENAPLKAKVYKLTYKGDDTFDFVEYCELVKGAARGALVFIDVDGDGFEDIVQYGANALEYANGDIAKWAGSMNLYMNDGNYNFTLTDTPANFFSGDTAFNGFLYKGDFDNDGKIDFALMTNNLTAGEGVATGLFVYINKGDKTFERIDLDSKLVYTHSNREQLSMTIGDFNNDSKLDIFAFCRKDATNPWSFPVELWTNNGDRTFSKSDVKIMGTNRALICTADFNLDGNLDMIYSGWNTSNHFPVMPGGNGDRVFVQLGNGDGTFNEICLRSDQPAKPFVYMVNGTYFAADLNGDGAPDIIQLGPGVSKLYYNKTKPANVTDASLSSLTVSEGTISPSFNPETVSYTINVSNETESVAISAEATQKGTVIDGCGNKTLSVGENKFKVVVTAKDGITFKVYTIVVDRAAALSNDATLSALTVSKGILAPAFAADVFEYTVDVANEVTSIVITATKNEPNSKVAGDGEKTNLTVGNNIFDVEVTAQDEVNKKTYTVTVIRAEKEVGINDNAIQDIVITVKDGRIFAEFSGKADVKLYSISGLLIHHTLEEEYYSQSVEKGVYIIVVNDVPFKVAL